MSGATGWLGRYVDHAFPDDRSPTLNVAVGPGRFPTVLRGSGHPGIGFASPESFRYSVLSSEKGQALYRELNEIALQKSQADLQFVSRTAVNANRASEQLRELARSYETPVSYPDTQFGNSVRTIAGLINGGLNRYSCRAESSIGQLPAGVGVAFLVDFFQDLVILVSPRIRKGPQRSAEDPRPMARAPEAPYAEP